MTETTSTVTHHPAVTPILPDEYVKDHWVFRGSRQSFNWFLRFNRAELVEAGALIAPTGRLMVVPHLFDQALHTIGKRMAATSLR
jgi:hypothetical protein